VKHGREPLATIYAQMLDREEFKGTLDYIFISEAIEVVDAITLPDPQVLMPNNVEPSDHYLVSAILRIAKSW